MRNEKASEIIDTLGGTDAVAALVVQKKAAVSHWRRWGIPPMTWKYLMATQKRKLSGITDSHLAQSKASGIV